MQWPIKRRLAGVLTRPLRQLVAWMLRMHAMSMRYPSKVSILLILAPSAASAPLSRQGRHPCAVSRSMRAPESKTRRLPCKHEGYQQPNGKNDKSNSRTTSSHPRIAGLDDDKLARALQGVIHRSIGLSSQQGHCARAFIPSPLARGRSGVAEQKNSARIGVSLLAVHLNRGIPVRCGPSGESSRRAGAASGRVCRD